MKIKIQHRLFFALLIASGLAVFCMFWIMQWSISQGFLQYVNTIDLERLERLSPRFVQAYEDVGSWDFLRGRLENWRALISPLHGDFDQELPRRTEIEQGPFIPPNRIPRPGIPGGLPNAPPPGPWLPQLSPAERDFGLRTFLLDAEHALVFGIPSKGDNATLIPLSLEGETIGYLGLHPRRQLVETQQLMFIKKQKSTMALIAGVILVLSFIFSLFLAKRLLQPIRTLTGATHRLACGEYATRVPVTSSDELGQLACDFNSLALTLENNEKARRQWVADISHELRTPIAILRGEIEALQDGVRVSSPEAISSLHAEVLHIGRLVDDLYQLSLSDVGAMTYRKSYVEIFTLLEQVLEPYPLECAARRLQLSVVLPDTASPLVFADPERLHQLFTNFLENSLKYTEQGGRLEVRGSCENGSVRIDFMDSAPGVPQEALGKLFDRLFRVENSRSRSSGGAGLGLAICKNIIEAHEGTVEARHSPLGGLWVAVTLPIKPG